jgi:hypothetical protein
VNDNKGTPVARGLNILLAVVMAFLVIAVLLLLGVAAIMITENSLRADLLSDLSKVDTGATPQNMAIACLGGALVAAAYVLVINILRKIVGTLLHGDPFIPANISRLRLMWIVIAVTEIIRIIITRMAAVNLSGGDEVSFDIRVGTWFLVFVIAALAEVFRHGAELRRDAELTI